MAARYFFILLMLLSLGAHADFDCKKESGMPTIPVKMPIEHILVIMQENHSFDNYFGKLNSEKFYGDKIDGLPLKKDKVDSGAPILPFHETSFCVEDTAHDWNAEHIAWNNGKNDNFIKVNGSKRTMGYYTDQELPYYYALANQFAVADRYFSPALAPTLPNRFFLYTGSAFGHIQNDFPPQEHGYTQRTIFDELNSKKISWKYYSSKKGHYLQHFKSLWRNDRKKMVDLNQYVQDLKNAKLPEVAFLESSDDQEDEHPPADIRIGQQWVAQKVQQLMDSSSWKTSVLFFTYDENGGLYDHVAPPEACPPDKIKPLKAPHDISGGYNRYGLRVPFIAISPYVKHHYVSHETYDHTSILKFIELKFGLPALTARDANANGMLDLFDFKNPEFKVVSLPKTTRAPASACKFHNKSARKDQ